MSIADATGPAGVVPSPLSGERIAYLGAALIVAFGATMTGMFGLPGLAMTALALVPVVFVVLLMITVGK
ncbi:hypothetical protein [Maliponia aquimaris]|uniref:Uncharacterized protein n=1 Tax=Maliponia aquimaris TaxID=1673631 RepID=A0A238L7B4_9RHOB|nr:hypothetical protein [Maliponia aquimaris]SMX50262.1 hypothetical protein MAA8898_04682 [Maliponia aquimaris]